MNIQVAVPEIRAKSQRKPAQSKSDVILRAAGRLVNTNGVHGWPMSKLAHATGYAKGTLYLYYDSREDLLRRLLVSEVERWLIIASGQIASAHSDAEVIEALWSAAENRPVMAQLLGNIQMAPEEIPNAALVHLGTQLSIARKLRQSHAMQVAHALVAALAGAFSVGRPVGAGCHAMATMRGLFEGIAFALLSDAGRDV